MKRTTLYISAALALALALAGCTKNEPADDSRLPAGEYPVVIQATGFDAEATPASRATVDGDWQGISSVAVEMNGAVKEYTVTASNADGYRSATLSRTEDPFWWTSCNDITVSAWWPCAETLPVVKVADDQSTLAAFQNSDFISAENQTVSYANPTLRFTHRTARVAIELKPGTGIASVAGATVSLVSLSAEGSNPTAIKTCNTSGDTYEALAAPQTVAAGKHFIQVVFGGVTFYFRPQNDVVLEAGSRYQYTVKVNATGLTLEGSTIGNWEPGGGESGAAEDTGYIYDEATHTYTVSNANGLLVWAEAAQNDRAIGCTLTADIDLTGKTWTPIGTESQPYIGTFDGGNHTITGLTIDLPGQEYVGMFSFIGKGGTVKDVTLEGVQIKGNAYVGGVAGYNYGGSLTNCTASGNVSGEYNVGGVAGSNSGTLTNCTASGDVSGDRQVGGVAGYNYSTITACYASGDVTGTTSYVGGVAGYNYGTITACYATGSVTGSGDNVGGVAAINSGTITACYALGNVSGESLVGGVAAINTGTITACYWSNYDGNGIGSGSGETTKVDGTTGHTWVEAQTGMNNAIDTWNTENPDTPCGWKFTGADATIPPVLIKQ